MDLVPSDLHGKRILASPKIATLKAAKRFRQMEGGCAQLGGMPDDITCNITSYLDVRSLLNMRMLNRSFRSLTSQSSAGWEKLCMDLWETKVHVCPEARACTDRMAAYRMSVLDARDRNHVLREELIYDPETAAGTVWSYRFKESAGADWTSWDPWFNGQPCRKFVFLEDGTVKTLVESDGDHGSMEDPTFRHQETALIDPPAAMSWRFLSRPLDMPSRPEGSYIRLSVSGRDVPTHCVRRSPTQNWGFVMESCWGVYASFELPKRPRSLRQRIRLRRAQDAFGNWFNVEVEDDESSEEGDDTPEESSPHGRLLIDDSSFAITSGLQWKEAFLYNFGARTLPEGDDAVDEFEQTYGAALSRIHYIDR
eukprot:scaffold2271_cov130-Cylindrotheca_fusiformis.AAC.25